MSSPLRAAAILFLKNDMRLSIIIPCFNERATIEQLLDRVAACPHEPKDIVVVDDGSSDGTGQLLLEFAKTRDFPAFFARAKSGEGRGDPHGHCGSFGRYRHRAGR